MTTAEQRAATIAAARAAALDDANKIRVDRAKLRLRIKAGEITASSVLEDWPECIRGCGTYMFLTYLPIIGNRPGRQEGRAFVLLRKANAPGHKRIDALTPHQLERLTRVVRDYENTRHPAEKGWA